MHPTDAVSRAAEIVGSKAELARVAGVKPPTVHQWLTGERPVPPARAAKIEVATDGAVTRRDLCPNFPWEESAA
ncbi:transcriptional regulator [Alloalcanivorax xenomutans]|uniref:transcriptional regulator n=1 Tax=Alloalcanivorax xenomutans TaxID=1094342 RepID=UPI003BAA2A4B